MSKQNFNITRKKGEWYHAIPTKIIHDYIHYRQGQIYENELILQRRCKTEVPTLWGNEKAVKFRPKCYFYPELPAQNKPHVLLATAIIHAL